MYNMSMDFLSHIPNQALICRPRNQNIRVNKPARATQHSCAAAPITAADSILTLIMIATEIKPWISENAAHSESECNGRHLSLHSLSPTYFPQQPFQTSSVYILPSR